MTLLRLIRCIIIITITLGCELTLANGETPQDACSKIVETNSGLEQEFDNWAKLGFDSEGLATLKELVVSQQFTMAQARKLIRTGNSDDFDPDFANLGINVDVVKAGSIVFHFKSPYTGDKVGRSEPIHLSSEAISRLGGDPTAFKAQEFIVTDLEERPLTLAILAESRPIAMIEYRLNGYRELHVGDVQVAYYARNLGLELILFKELHRRYPMVETADISLPAPVDSLISPTIRSYEALREFVSQNNLGDLRLLNRANQPKSARLRIKNSESPFRGVGISKF